MIRRTCAAVAVFLVATCALAQGSAAISDPLLAEMVAWTEVATDELRLEGAPAPHRVVTAVVDLRAYGARASFGELLYEHPNRSRQGRVEVVVGDDRLDSCRFSDSRQSRWAGRRLNPRQSLTIATDDGELALARDLWASTDASYKRAVQMWKTKVAARRALGSEDSPPDWSAAEPAVDLDPSPLAPVDQETLRAIALEASAALREVGGLDEAEVTVNGVGFRYYTATSEGTRLIQPDGYAVVHALADLRRADGVEIRDELQWVVSSVSDLPAKQEIVGAVRAMGQSVLARAGAATVDYYEGPVVFSDRAAAEFFRYLVPPEIAGTPPPPAADRSYQRQTRGGPRLGRRLLPDGWSIVDDPSKAPAGLPGGYVYDREGVRGQRVEVVRDGYVRDLLMSRIPRLELTRSNGHARGSIGGGWVARPAVWKVTPPESQSVKAFAKAVDSARGRARQDRILVVHRLGRDRVGRLPAPTHAVWRYPDGREEPVDALEFQNVDRRVLRDVAAAAGGEQVLAYLADFDPQSRPERDRGLATVLTAPRQILVEDLELVFPGPSGKPRSYPAPPLASAGR